MTRDIPAPARSPRPQALLLDQNLQSQVIQGENVTTGAEIAKRLRAAGYEGVIVLRSATVYAIRHRTDHLIGGSMIICCTFEARNDARLLVAGRGRMCWSTGPRVRT